MVQSAKYLDNPFVTTGYAGPEYFCDRETETARLTSLLMNGNNVALISPRRYGKTDLLRHCFAQKEIAGDFYTFIVDIYSTKSVAEMVSKLGTVILETLKPKGRKAWEKFLSALSSIRSGISYDMNGIPTWSLSVGDINSPAVTLDEIFKYLDQADKPCLVAIDEFQQVTKYGDDGIEAELRTHVQYCSNARFVFSGSRQHLMGNMFTSPARPFYQSVTIFGLEKIPEDKYAAFCRHHFEKGGKVLDKEVVPALYDRFEGITYYLQRVMNQLFQNTPAGGSCSTGDIEKAVQDIIGISSPIYEDLLYQLPEKQSQVLIAIGKEGKATNLTSGKFCKKYGLQSPSSVKSAVPALIEKGLLTRERDYYLVYDLFFNIWMKQHV